MEYHCESVAVPLLSTGNYGYPKEQAFRIAADVITRFVLEHDLTVYLVLYDRESLATGQKLFADVAEYIDDHYVAGKDESYWFGLRLTEQETTDLLKSAGYAFSDSSKQDWIVRYCLEHKIYNINQINALLFEYDQDQLGN